MDEHIPDLLLAVFRKNTHAPSASPPHDRPFPYCLYDVVSRSQHPLSGDRKQEPGDKRVSCPGGRTGGRTGRHAYWGRITGGSITLVNGRKQ